METETLSTIKLRGIIQMALLDPSGRIVLERRIENLAVTVGRAWILGQLQTVNQATAQTISYLAIGSTTTAPTTADTALGGEVTRANILTFVTTGMTVNPPSWQAQVSFATNVANTTLGEVGLFNSNGGGTMIAHATFTSFIKATSNTLAVSYTLQD
jgi:hypothetical protein